MIMDFICKFLQFDLGTLFASSGESSAASNLSHSSDVSIIEHNYGPKLKIYDGAAHQSQNRNNCDEHDLLNDLFSSDEMKEIERIAAESDSDSDSADESECTRSRENLDNGNAMDDPEANQNLFTKWFCGTAHKLRNVSGNSPKMSMSSQDKIEMRAKNLWQSMQKDNGANLNWWEWKSWQKLPFYWAAISNEILSEEPLENFERFFFAHIPRGRRKSKKSKEKMLIVWHSLDTRKKLPFVVEAFVAKVSAGKVDINNERELRKIIQELQNKCD